MLQSIKPHFLDGREINGRMRAILVDWLVQVHSKFRLLQETLYMCIAIMDRYLQVSVASRSLYQCLTEHCIYVMPRCGISDKKTKTANLGEAKELQVLEREAVQVCQTSGDAYQWWVLPLGQPAEQCLGKVLHCHIVIKGNNTRWSERQAEAYGAIGYWFSRPAYSFRSSVFFGIKFLHLKSKEFG